MNEIREVIDEYIPHSYCEDAWYSCPLAPEGCCDSSKDKNKCYCGAEDCRNKLETEIKKIFLKWIGEDEEGFTAENHIRAEIRKKVESDHLVIITKDSVVYKERGG